MAQQFTTKEGAYQTARQRRHSPRLVDSPSNNIAVVETNVMAPTKLYLPLSSSCLYAEFSP